jgi:hypothetical protein
LLDLINQSFEVMQTSLAQYKIAGYPPDILINVPKRVCRFFEFYKAPELIALGREIARIRWIGMRVSNAEMCGQWPIAASPLPQLDCVHRSAGLLAIGPAPMKPHQTGLQQPIPYPASVTINRGWVGSSASFWRKWPTTIRR